MKSPSDCVNVSVCADMIQLKFIHEFIALGPNKQKLPFTSVNHKSNYKPKDVESEREWNKKKPEQHKEPFYIIRRVIVCVCFRVFVYIKALRIHPKTSHRSAKFNLCNSDFKSDVVPRYLCGIFIQPQTGIAFSRYKPKIYKWTCKKKRKKKLWRKKGASSWTKVV